MSATLAELPLPIVLAPLAGGPSTPQLTAAVSESGGFGFLAAGYLSAAALEQRIAETRELTDRPFGVNVFVPSDGPADPSAYGPYVERLAREAERVGVELGSPRFDDDDWDAKIELLRSDPVAAISFTFGCPPREIASALRAGGSEVWATVTTPDEARQAARAGADVLVAQGSEAGGHRASFTDRTDVGNLDLAELLAAVKHAADVPIVATGGIATAQDAAGALSAGAQAVQVGTAFMLSPEAGTSEVHRQAIASERPTVLTRAFTGRLARGIRNRFAEEHGPHAPVAYPEIHHVTAPLRAMGRRSGDSEIVNLWAGKAHALAQARPAGEITALLAP